VSIIQPTGRIAGGVIESRVVFERREGALLQRDAGE
jgi:hypothetical protein